MHFRVFTIQFSLNQQSFLDDMNGALFSDDEKIPFIDNLRSSYKIILGDFLQQDTKNQLGYVSKFLH
jgi:hypothetical protein